MINISLKFFKFLWIFCTCLQGFVSLNWQGRAQPHIGRTGEDVYHYYLYIISSNIFIYVKNYHYHLLYYYLLFIIRALFMTLMIKTVMIMNVWNHYDENLILSFNLWFLIVKNQRSGPFRFCIVCPFQNRESPGSSCNWLTIKKWCQFYKSK